MRDPYQYEINREIDTAWSYTVSQNKTKRLHREKLIEKQVAYNTLEHASKRECARQCVA